MDRLRSRAIFRNATPSRGGVAAGPQRKMTGARVPGEEQPALAHRMPRHVVEHNTADLVRSASKRMPSISTCAPAIPPVLRARSSTLNPPGTDVTFPTSTAIAGGSDASSMACHPITQTRPAQAEDRRRTQAIQATASVFWALRGARLGSRSPGPRPPQITSLAIAAPRAAGNASTTVMRDSPPSRRRQHFRAVRRAHRVRPACDLPTHEVESLDAVPSDHEALLAVIHSEGARTACRALATYVWMPI